MGEIGVPLLRRGQQSPQVEIGAAYEDFAGYGFGRSDAVLFEIGIEHGIQRLEVLRPLERERDFGCGRLELGYVKHCAFVDPGFEGSDLSGRKWCATHGHQGLPFSIDALDEQATGAVAWDNRRSSEAAFEQRITGGDDEPALRLVTGMTTAATGY